MEDIEIVNKIESLIDESLKLKASGRTPEIKEKRQAIKAQIAELNRKRAVLRITARMSKLEKETLMGILSEDVVVEPGPATLNLKGQG